MAGEDVKWYSPLGKQFRTFYEVKHTFAVWPTKAQSWKKYELKKDYNIFKYSAENMEYSKQILEDSKKILELSVKRYVEAKNNYSDLVVNTNSHQEVLTQYLETMSRHFYSYLELMQDIGHDILIDM